MAGREYRGEGPVRRKLPLGIQNFREIRDDNCYYVDKTPYLARLVEEGKHYFLSRPRRFGKSLFVDTLKELFEGNEPLFRGLAIHDRWDWSVRRPVIRFDFSGGDYATPELLRESVMEQLTEIESAAGVTPRHRTAPGRLRDLVRALREDSGQRVVVLVDEYDKPILDALDDPERAKTHRDFLRGFYGTVKSVDAHLDGMTADADLLSAFDVEEMAPEALLFQSGYLTIVDEKDEGDGPVYRLGYPNREVRQSLNRQLLRAVTPVRQALSGARLRELFAANDFAGIEALFRSCFDAIPYEWHNRNEIARYEGYYASVLYSHLAGMDVAVEDSSNRGRVDLAVRCGGQVYLFECKVAEREPSGAALAQLRERDYAAKYRASGRPVHLIGVEFRREPRNIVAFETAPA